MFRVIRELCETLDPHPVARVAGGWVRDKLLGLDSDDIDICVEHIDAYEFGKLLNSVVPGDRKKQIVIKSNPEHSKLIETTRVLVLDDKWIDICNLRAPKGVVGTPQTDAEHRDFTINALFYNICTRKVEDLVGGIDDLENRILKTPISPDQTFDEDPLRVLRAFRFMHRLNLKMSETLIEAAKNAKLHFDETIARNRISIELMKIIEKDGLIPFIEFLIGIDFFDSVFDPFHLWDLNPSEALARVKVLKSRNPNDLIIPLYFSAIYTPLLHMPPYSDKLRKSKPISAIDCAMLRVLQPPHKTNEVSSILMKAADTFHILKFDRVSVGQWIREAGENWKYVQYILFADDQYMKFVNEFIPYVEMQNLQHIYSIKPLMNGSELASFYQIKTGPKIKGLIEELLLWQLSNPDGTLDDYKNYVLNKKQ